MHAERQRQGPRDKIGLEGLPPRFGEHGSWIFGDVLGGTAIMTASPLTAPDLPLKILVWQDDGGTVWVSHLDADWLAARHRFAHSRLRKADRAHIALRA